MGKYNIDEDIEIVAKALYNEPLHFKKPSWEETTAETRAIFIESATCALNASNAVKELKELSFLNKRLERKKDDESRVRAMIYRDFFKLAHAKNVESNVTATNGEVIALINKDLASLSGYMSDNISLKKALKEANDTISTLRELRKSENNA